MSAPPRTQAAHQLQQEELKERAVVLYRQGFSMREAASMISDPTGDKPPVSRMFVKRAVDGYLKSLHARAEHSVDAYRREELDKLKMLEQSLARAVRDGDVAAIRTSVRISERRSKLLGLDAPIALDVTVTQTPPAVVELVETARARMAAMN